MKTRPRALAALTLMGACALGTAATAEARTTHSTLRVEGPSSALDPGTNYSNGTIRTTNTSACGKRDSRRERLEGANAMGIIGHAARVNLRLRPFRTSDTFDFGTIVCRIGDFVGFDNTAWLYKVDHAFASVGGDQLSVGRRADVLWYFANFSTGRNTGDELELVGVPDRVQPGESFEVTAVAYDGSGQRSPAAEVRVSGSNATAPQPTGANGRTTVTATGSGAATLRGRRGNDIASAPVKVCVNQALSKCPKVRGEVFVGTNRADKILATRGADTIRARGGRDLIRARDDRDFVNVRRGGRDRVNCGRGRDVVRASSRDRVADNCEVVR